jgi:Fic family protein
MERTITIEWEGRRIEAADPAPIADAPIDLSASTIRATERAATTLETSARRTGPDLEVIGRLLLRAEGLSSSAIEGLRAPAEAVALAEEGVGGDDTASWVADNLTVLVDALATNPPLTTETLRAWHGRLMRHAIDFDPDHAGTWRPVVGWIGGANPLVAAHVASPPDLIAPGMDDLVAFLRRDDLDPITVAAIAHAQFETIHPFADGNGRLGRSLIGWVLASSLDVTIPPPVSTAFARDIGGYLSGLTLYRQGQIDHWVRWFANAVIDASARSDAMLDGVDRLLAEWRDRIADLRADAAARRIVETLVQQPVTNAAIVSDRLGLSRTAARNGLNDLAARGIVHQLPVQPSSGGRPSTWWAATDILKLIRA